MDLGPAGDLLVGADTSDDAAVYRLAPDLAIVLTADLITPLVADPALFGRVAAQNSLSDIYAMGGVPLLAINLCCFPGEAPDAVLAEILEGGAREVLAAGAVVAGGHTVKDPELKYGLCVVGRVEPDAIWRNSAARVGDRLLLTKPIGSGMLYTGIQKGQAADAVLERAADEVLASSNRLARDALRPLRVSAATDVTGFGLLGHLAELAVGSGVRVVLDAQAVPLLPEAGRLAAAGVRVGAAKRNQAALGDRVGNASEISEAWAALLWDPQTSGGLLVCVHPEDEARAVAALEAAGTPAAAVVGRVEAAAPGGRIRVGGAGSAERVG